MYEGTKIYKNKWMTRAALNQICKNTLNTLVFYLQVNNSIVLTKSFRMKFHFNEKYT